MADTHKMKPEDVKAAGVEGSKRPPGQNPGEVLHQRRNFPYSYKTMAIGGLLISAAIGYISPCMLRKSLKPLPKMLARLLLELPNPKTLTLGSSSSRSSGSIILELAMKEGFAADVVIVCLICGPFCSVYL